ncbi:MAG: ABC transporter ATP-binding protein [Clostridia bacterium]|nr:ABC transporter ATP-binding protein [Clostridia bacterium]
MSYIRPHRGEMALGLVVKFFATMMDLMIPYVLEIIIDDVIPTGDVNRILVWGGVMALCAVFSVVTNIMANRMATRSSGKVTRKLRHDLFSRIGYLSSPQLDRFTASSLVSRLTSDTYNVNQMLTRVQRIGVRGPILLIGGMVFTLSLDPVLTMVLVGMLPLIACVVFFVTKFSIPVYTKCQKALDKLVMTVQENVTGVRIIKALSKSERERERFSSVNEELSDNERKAGILMAITNPSTTLILNVGLALIVLVGAYRADSALTERGTIIAFLSYFTIILNAMLGITRIFIVCSRAIASANRIDEVLRAEEDMPVLAETDCAGDKRYRLEFRNVSFSYNGVEDNLTGVSFALRPGETLGIIGATGSGKSTVINLILRFYDPRQGAVFIDGRDVRTLTRRDLTSRIGVAMQNDFIMAGTLRDNIDYGRGLSEAQLWKAVRTAQAEEFISQRQEGLDFVVAQRGSSISGGQRQRMLIARAIAAEPDLLLLDDSSSALDYKTDAALRRALHTNYPNMTTVIVAQRVSSIKNANEILVLDDGRPIGAGTHDELVVSCDAYRRIAHTQMGGERDA